jgi:hypothetical protein
MVNQLVLNSMLKEVLLEMEVIKSFNTTLLVLFIFLTSIVKILVNFTELVVIVNQDIKEKELLKYLILLLKMLVLLLDTTPTLEILSLLKVSVLLVDMFAEPSKEEMMEKNQLL